MILHSAAWGRTLQGAALAMAGAMLVEQPVRSQPPPLLAPQPPALEGEQGRGASCTPSPTELCLLSSRFRVSMDHGPGDGSPAQAVAVTKDIGYFYFTQPEYVELYIHVINGCFINQRIWAFVGSLTDTEFQLTVAEQESGQSRVYFNPSGSRANILDTAAFATCPVTAVPGNAHSRGSEGKVAPEIGPEALDSNAAGPTCTPDSTTHCLASGRFRTQLTWQSGSGSGPGFTVPLTSHSGGFYFFSPTDLDLVVKVVETPGFFEVHYSGLSTVAYALTVTDTINGCVRTYLSPQGTSSAVGDLDAFSTSALSCEIFSDGFETGDTSAWSLVVG